MALSNTELGILIACIIFGGLMVAAMTYLKFVRKKVFTRRNSESVKSHSVASQASRATSFRERANLHAESTLQDLESISPLAGKAGRSVSPKVSSGS